MAAAQRGGQGAGGGYITVMYRVLFMSCACPFCFALVGAFGVVTLVFYLVWLSMKGQIPFHGKRKRIA